MSLDGSFWLLPWLICTFHWQGQAWSYHPPSIYTVLQLYTCWAVPEVIHAFVRFWKSCTIANKCLFCSCVFHLCPLHSFHHLACSVTQSCLTLCNPMDCIGFSRQEYWAELPFPPPGESSWPRDQTCLSCVSYIGRLIVYRCATWEAFMIIRRLLFRTWVKHCFTLILNLPFVYVSKTWLHSFEKSERGFRRNL